MALLLVPKVMSISASLSGVVRGNEQKAQGKVCYRSEPQWILACLLGSHCLA